MRMLSAVGAKMIWAGMAVSLLFACAPASAPPAAPQSYESDLTTDMFSAGYESIADFFIDPIPTDALALSALNGLSTLQNDLRFVQRRGKLIVMKADAEFAEFPSPDADETTRWARLTAAAIGAARRSSVELAAIDNEALFSATFGAMVGKLDKYSRYLGADDAQREKNARTGYTGIGIQIFEDRGGFYVTRVFAGSPAEEAGLESGDQILRVAGKPVQGLAIEELVRRLKGPPGTNVFVTLERDTIPYNADITRRKVIQPTIVARDYGSIAYFFVQSFNQNTAQSLEEAIEAHQKRRAGATTSAVILDLRHNRGGPLNQAIEVADLFLDEGRILTTQGRHTNSQQKFSAEQGQKFEGVPMVVLIDSESASSAEIVSSALQDQRRALLIGARSFGKGTVQQIITLPNSGEMILTWARMRTPSGYALSRFGVFPSICTANFSSAEEALQQLRDGELNPGAEIRRRHALEHASPAKQQEFDQWCKSRRQISEDDEDIKLARALLEAPHLYELALNASTLALAKPN